MIYIYAKPPDCVDTPYIMSFSQLVPWKHKSVRQVLSGHQLEKTSDLRWIMSTNEGSFVFIISTDYINTLRWFCIISTHEGSFVFIIHPT